ncbi:HD-GYP domain-containing protein [Metabacillus malikii]|uniref:Nucleotidyltransferase with HDIG domain n=1 Tax=Metabacillus malikii TaxID=1504265 RepID=A0ABT9ZCL4_9BACI|nr:HD-GYP domain-containing protein [Metabacillus malikii]MDQ0229993.1 putative nucleotidyltransferase with HDIG domain [Metabacillus malikii]
MRLITLNRSESGYRLGKSIYYENGKILLAKGTILSDSLIKRLTQFNVFTIYIEDDDSEGIEVVESIPEELRVESIEAVTSGLTTIAEYTSNTSNIQGMMQSSKSIDQLQKTFKNITTSLVENRTALNLLATTKIVDNHLYTHSLNVAIYSCQLAIENGLPRKEIEEIGLGALLHDLGKMFIPPEVLNKPDKLTNEEFNLIKLHTKLGFEILRKVHGLPLVISHCALQHHERIDGKGYPRGITSNNIHPYAKILSVADVFDAVTSQRVYRPAMLPHKGLEVLYSGSGTQFEKKQIELFRNCIAIYPPGLTVKLNDGRTGIVVHYNFHSVGRPLIRIIKDQDNQKVQPYEIDLSHSKHLTLEIISADALL